MRASDFEAEDVGGEEVSAFFSFGRGFPLARVAGLEIGTSNPGQTCRDLDNVGLWVFLRLFLREEGGMARLFNQKKAFDCPTGRVRGGQEAAHGWS